MQITASELEPPNITAQLATSCPLRTVSDPACHIPSCTHIQNVVRRSDTDDYRPQRRFANILNPTAPPPPSFLGVGLSLTRLRVGTDTSQGKGQVISNINACLAVQATIRSTLGPYGGDLLMVEDNGRQTITNDGATVMKVRAAQHPIPTLTWRHANSHSSYSSWTLSIPLPSSLSTLPDHKTQKSVTAPPLWSSSPVRS